MYTFAYYGYCINSSMGFEGTMTLLQSTGTTSFYYSKILRPVNDKQIILQNLYARAASLGIRN
jgi:hypothetical protein